MIYKVPKKFVYALIEKENKGKKEKVFTENDAIKYIKATTDILGGISHVIIE